MTKIKFKKYIKTHEVNKYIADWDVDKAHSLFGTNTSIALSHKDGNKYWVKSSPVASTGEPRLELFSKV